MYPLTCPDGSPHTLPDNLVDSDDDAVICSKCGIRQQEYDASSKKQGAIVDALTVLILGDPALVAEVLRKGMDVLHRTKQQDFIRMIIIFLSNMTDMSTDLRNAAAIDWCKRVSELDCNLPRI
jgi:hypothetical protein